ncbi:PREDICTED: uncharacterized protein LOC103069636 [Lipotes vexillifer]|uniref:protein S-acyltransferase n=1 Tax=Lipotes vexillifer TaxID=118797 RepID=A0A340YIS6_LIPVE|nr:PREDICTED: uncharacterized protein LOC103069636 [Lipotes vexillifer]
MASVAAAAAGDPAPGGVLSGEQPAGRATAVVGAGAGQEGGDSPLGRNSPADPDVPARGLGRKDFGHGCQVCMQEALGQGRGGPGATSRHHAAGLLTGRRVSARPAPGPAHLTGRKGHGSLPPPEGLSLWKEEHRTLETSPLLLQGKFAGFLVDESMAFWARISRFLLPGTTSRRSTKTVPPRRPRVSGWSQPVHYLQIVAWIVFFILVFTTFGIFIPLLPPEWRYIAYSVTGGICLFHLSVHLIALSIDPAEANVRLKKNYSRSVPTFDRSKHAHVIQEQYCHLCEVAVSVKAKHCSTCNKCVSGFDHHCKWLNNCVGSRNYWYFFASVASASAGLLCVAATLLCVFTQYAINPAGLRTDPHYRSVSDQNTWLLLLPLFPVRTSAPVFLGIGALTLLLDLVSLLLLGHLLLFHLHLRAKKLSTFDYIMQNNKRQSSKSLAVKRDVTPQRKVLSQQQEAQGVPANFHAPESVLHHRKARGHLVIKGKPTAIKAHGHQRETRHGGQSRSMKLTEQDSTINIPGESSSGLQSEVEEIPAATVQVLKCDLPQDHPPRELPETPGAQGPAPTESPLQGSFSASRLPVESVPETHALLSSVHGHRKDTWSQKHWDVLRSSQKPWSLESPVINISESCQEVPHAWAMAPHAQAPKGLPVIEEEKYGMKVAPVASPEEATGPGGSTKVTVIIVPEGPEPEDRAAQPEETWALRPTVRPRRPPSDPAVHRPSDPAVHRQTPHPPTGSQAQSRGQPPQPCLCHSPESGPLQAVAVQGTACLTRTAVVTPVLAVLIPANTSLRFVPSPGEAAGSTRLLPLHLDATRPLPPIWVVLGAGAQGPEPEWTKDQGAVSSPTEGALVQQPEPEDGSSDSHTRMEPAIPSYHEGDSPSLNLRLSNQPPGEGGDAPCLRAHPSWRRAGLAERRRQVYREKREEATLEEALRSAAFTQVTRGGPGRTQEDGPPPAGVGARVGAPPPAPGKASQLRTAPRVRHGPASPLLAHPSQALASPSRCPPNSRGAAPLPAPPCSPPWGPSPATPDPSVGPSVSAERPAPGRPQPGGPSSRPSVDPRPGSRRARWDRTGDNPPRGAVGPWGQRRPAL